MALRYLLFNRMPFSNVMGLRYDCVPISKTILLLLLLLVVVVVVVVYIVIKHFSQLPCINDDGIFQV